VKPHRKIFDITVGKLGCRLEQSVFIDDVPEFVNAAEKIGINAILFESACQIRKKITQFGLNCIS
jgi:HAD superfamily hydrolase (TIGR01509 family)